MDAVLFDDDVYFAGLVRELFSAQGLTLQYFPSGERALEHVRREKPALVLADIMMPGTDGISLCAAIKNDPELGFRTKVAVVSGKSFPEDRVRAESARADAFIPKPLDVKSFSHYLRDSIPRVSGGGSVSGASVRFWQDGGAAGAAIFRLRRSLFVLGAGAGLKRGLESGVGSGVSEAWVLLSKVHPDHCADARALRILRDSGVSIHIVTPERSQAAAALSGLGRPEQDFQIHEMREGMELRCAGASLRAMLTMHPGLCLGYRLEEDSLSLAYFPDGELGDDLENSMTDYADKLDSFCKGVRVLIHDSRFLRQHLPSARASGHSTPEAALALAQRSGAQRLVLHRLDTRYSLRERREIEDRLNRAAALEQGRVSVIAALEGSVVSAA